MVFLNSTMLSVSDKSDLVNKRTQEISELIKLHIQAHKFIRQLADFMVMLAILLRMDALFIHDWNDTRVVKMG